MTLAASVPRSRLKNYAVTGHILLWEWPERFAEDTMDFLATTSRMNDFPDGFHMTLQARLLCTIPIIVEPPLDVPLRCPSGGDDLFAFEFFID